MPKGPKGEKRPADVIANALRVARIATGEEPEELTDDGKNAIVQVAMLYWDGPIDQSSFD